MVSAAAEMRAKTNARSPAGALATTNLTAAAATVAAPSTIGQDGSVVRVAASTPSAHADAVALASARPPANPAATATMWAPSGRHR